MSAAWRNRSIGLALAAAVVLLDQGIKALLAGPWNLRETGQIVLLPFFNLTWAQNFGVSFGLFEATSPAMRWGLVAATGLIALAVLAWLLRERKLWDIAPLALWVGGGVGNICDRVRFGYVVDYADLHIGGFRPFQIFNLADAAITFGVLIIVARALWKPREDGLAQQGAVA